MGVGVVRQGRQEEREGGREERQPTVPRRGCARRSQPQGPSAAETVRAPAPPAHTLLSLFLTLGRGKFPHLLWQIM